MDAVELPSHRHPLNLRELVSGAGGERRVCGLCGKEVINGFVYVCSECYFIAHLNCAENPPDLMIDMRKIHEHTLTLLPRYVSFICNACGLSGDKSPYVCLKCSFMIHGDCLNIPRVININRHEHRLVYRCFLGPGNWRCGVCRQKVDGNYGAYRCVRCHYAVHTECAKRKDVWDGEELWGTPADITTQLYGFDEGILVRGYCQEHVLKLQSDNDMARDVVCSGCSFPIASDPFYTCQDCNFLLHFTCANLSMTIHIPLHVHPLSLRHESDVPSGISRCGACGLHFNGFRYRCMHCNDEYNVELDVKCSSVSEPFEYPLHPHPLFINPGTGTSCCSLCNHPPPNYFLSCIQCDFMLCFACATSPDKIKYKYDEHLLHHTIGDVEDVTTITNPYWCDICEKKIEQHKHHYKCSDCGPVLHAECALGSFRNMRPGFRFITKHGHEFEVILNDRISLLRCSQCHNDCHEPLLLMSTTTTTGNTIYLCSSTCFELDASVSP